MNIQAIQRQLCTLLATMLLACAAWAQGDTIRVDVDCNDPQGIVDADWELWFKIKNGNDVKTVRVWIPNSTSSEGAALALSAAIRRATGTAGEVIKTDSPTEEDVSLPNGWSVCVDEKTYAYKDQNEDGKMVAKTSPHVKIHVQEGGAGEFKYEKPSRGPDKRRGVAPSGM